MISKIEQYLNESTTVNRFGKIISKYTSDLKKLEDNTVKQAELFIKQVNDPEELDKMMNMLDDGDEIQDYIIGVISERISKLEK